jgi:hypothetical protein
LHIGPKAIFITTLLSLIVLVAPSSGAADHEKQLPASTRSGFSAEDFDWREMVPYLLEAAAMPEAQGVQMVLENSRVLRWYISRQVLMECKKEAGPCFESRDGSALTAEVSKRIDQVVEEGLFYRKKRAILDYPLARPFAFSEIAAARSEKPEAYLMLALGDRSYTAAQVQAKYGAPYDTDVVQWYSVFKYRLDNPGYTSRASFEIDPVDGAVIKVAISVKTRKTKIH